MIKETVALVVTLFILYFLVSDEDTFKERFTHALGCAVGFPLVMGVVVGIMYTLFLLWEWAWL